MQLIAGMYPAVLGPTPLTGDEEFALLGALVDSEHGSKITGLELPWSGGQLGRDEERLFTTTPETWRHVVTLIPHTMVSLANDARYGLASSDDDGRRAAVQDLSALREHLAGWAERLGRPVASAVEIHSAPRVADGISPQNAALARSLDELVGWDWQGATLLVEHCATAYENVAPAKGFLDLQSELRAVRSVQLASTTVRLGINWGRSAIERRDPDVVLEHLEIAGDMLGALMFSGVAPNADGSPDPEWPDSHLPPQEVVSESLLTRERIAEAKAAAPHVPIIGFKMSAGGAESVEQRADALARCLAAVSQ